MKRRAFALSLPATLLASGCSREEATVSAAGTAFGTEIAITLPKSAGTEIFEGAFAEIARLESEFTLFVSNSPLRQLNETGRLENPAAEWIDLLAICDRLHELTGGAFDPTVQPLWELFERHFSENPLSPEGPDTAAVAEARSRIGWENVSWSREEIRLGQPGMALTLNGIAPGFVADRTVEYLRGRGFSQGLVNTGEFRALGTQPGGMPWRVDIRGSDETIVGFAELDGTALATSAGYATAFDLEQRFHHLFHPGQDSFQPASRIIAVEAPEAALADALATAGGVMDPEEFVERIGRIPGVSARIFE